MRRAWLLGLLLGASLLYSAPARAQTTEGLGRPERPPEIQATKLSKVPKQTKFVKAEYPKAAEEQRLEAEVILLLDINAEGKVDAVGIVEPATPAGMGFDEAAMAAAQQFEFDPAELDGKPVAVQLNYRYRFTLTPKAEPAPKPAPPTEAPRAAERPATDSDRAAPTTPGVVNLKGVLLERGTRLPMAGVIVTVFRDDGPQPVGFEATADAEGRFEFVDLAPGLWKILVEAPGYYPYRTSETIVSGERVDARYFVERGSYNPYDVTVTAIQPKKEVSRTVLSAAEAERVPGGIGDPLAVVQSFAGVARTPMSSLLVVRGSDPNDSLILVDSTHLPTLYHFGGLRTVLPAGMLDSIEFYPGNFSPEYGNATGGIVDVRLKKLEPKKIGGYADVSILDTSLYLEAPLGDKAAVAIAGRRSYIDAVLTAVVPDNAGVELVTAPRYYDYQVLASYRPTPAHDLRAFFFGSDDRFEMLFENPADLDPALTENDFGYTTTFYRALLSDRYVPGERFQNTVKVSVGKDSISADIAQFTMNMDFLTAEVREKAHYAFDRHFAVNAGGDLSVTHADILLRIPAMTASEANGGGDQEVDLRATDETNLNVTGWYGGAFAEAELTPGAGLRLMPGIRVDRFGLTKKGSVTPRLAGRWEFMPGTTLKGALGLYTIEPHFLEVNKDFGNPDLDPERAIHYSVGLEHKPLPQLTIDGTLFYKRLTHLATPTSRVVVENGVERPLHYENGGSGRVRGFELVVRQELWEGLSGWIAYTLSQAKRLQPGDTEEQLFEWDQTHILNVVAAYVLPRNWQVSTRFRFSTGRPMTPVTGGVFNASTDQYSRINGAFNSRRTSTFHQLDLRVDKRWIYQQWILGAYLDIQNVYNQSNSDGTEYSFDFRESRRQGGMPLLPIVGVRGEF
jgi:TonB family protein